MENKLSKILNLTENIRMTLIKLEDNGVDIKKIMGIWEIIREIEKEAC